MVTWTAPAALWLLLAVPLVWLAHRFARTNFNPRQRAAAGGGALAAARRAGDRRWRGRSSRRSSSQQVDRLRGRRVAQRRAAPRDRSGGTPDRRAQRGAPARHTRASSRSAATVAAPWRAPPRCASSRQMDPRSPAVRRVSTAAAPISKRRWSRPAASWPPATFRASCSSATGTPTAGDIDAAIVRLATARAFRCRSSRSCRDRSATPGSTRSFCPIAFRPAALRRHGQRRQPARRHRRRRAAVRRHRARHAVGRAGKGPHAGAARRGGRGARRATSCRPRSRSRRPAGGQQHAATAACGPTPRVEGALRRRRRRPAPATCPARSADSGFDVTVRPPSACRRRQPSSIRSTSSS